MRWDYVGLILLVVVRAKRAVETGQFSHSPVAVQCSFGAAFWAFARLYSHVAEEDLQGAASWERRALMGVKKWKTYRTTITSGGFTGKCLSKTKSDHLMTAPLLCLSAAIGLAWGGGSLSEVLPLPPCPPARPFERLKGPETTGLVPGG